MVPPPRVNSILTGFFAPTLLPACGLETATDKKPDHVAVKLDVQSELVSHRLLLGNQQLLENPPEEEAWVTAKQQDQVTDLRCKLLDTGPCNCFKWPSLLG
eukprot:6490738-Amphidinium_carterae.2